MPPAADQTDATLLSRLATWAAQAFETAGESDMIAWIDEDLLRQIARSGRITADQMVERAGHGQPASEEMA
ncbi:hypothetical protein [Rhizobium halophytocola]|uniref:Uncharacterized protein n=1 Tax=Rhizobium halophytocola TaxID=735519 RepID=A0ABS4DY90_9HYPH|nr:hypothetical protein [Rhizobium halophytocola]MBP1850648.1 hypothetical protein [Rhizobium halophytocola]